MTRPQFYVPYCDHWNWELISKTFVQIQLQRARESYAQTGNALDNLDADIEKIGQEIRGQWAVANANIMRAFEARLKEIRAEKKRIMFVRVKLSRIIERMDEHVAS